MWNLFLTITSSDVASEIFKAASNSASQASSSIDITAIIIALITALAIYGGILQIFSTKRIQEEDLRKSEYLKEFKEIILKEAHTQQENAINQISELKTQLEECRKDIENSISEVERIKKQIENIENDKAGETHEDNIKEINSLKESHNKLLKHIDTLLRQIIEIL